MNNTVRRLLCVTVGTLATTQIWATCGGGGGGGSGGMMGGSGSGGNEQVYVVPWKVVTEEAKPPAGGLAVYWFPASQQELERSSLRSSRTLTLAAAQCVTTAIADQSSPVGRKFAASEMLPLAILVDGDGSVIGKVTADAKGRLSASDVDKLLNTAVKKRENEWKDSLKSAQAQARADRYGAIAQYQKVLTASCLSPGVGKDAARALRKLGVDPQNAPVGAIPKLDPAFNARIGTLLNRGLDAENRLDLASALKYYQAANALDPADPTPLRFLGELYRHHTGEWDKARAAFEQILAMRADPLARAVALHGIGKMTIHEGEFKQGLALMEQSVAVYPMAIANRNLAVYWISEGDRVKGEQYTRAAYELDRNDAYNQVFAAAFQAGSGQRGQALATADRHQGLLPASYNLAAIYAQLGLRDKALALLRRHFYQYERNDAVRAKEMTEARVDAVFASLHRDPAFIELTSSADGRLPLPAAGGVSGMSGSPLPAGTQ